MTTRRRTTRAIVVAALLVPLLAGGKSSAADARLTPTAVALDPTTARVTWTGTPPPSTQFRVYARDLALPGIPPNTPPGTPPEYNWVTARARAGVTEVTLTDLVPGRSYAFDVQALNGSTHAGVWSSPPITMPTIPCPGSQCVRVDLTSGTQTAQAAFNGLSGGVGTHTNPARVHEVSPRAWRIGAGPDEADTFDWVRTHAPGATITLVLSNSWHTAHRTYDGAPSVDPWTNWAYYEWWVEQIVTWHIQTGREPDYWEIQNEPDYPGSYAAGTNTAVWQVLEQFRRAHNVIRRVDPDAKIVGWSVALFFGEDPAYAKPDLRTFLQHAVDNGLHYDAIAWHENGGGGDGWQNRPQSYASHLQQYQSVLEEFPTLRADPPEIHINEWGALFAMSVPGWFVGQVTRMERGGAVLGSSTCVGVEGTGPPEALGCSDMPGNLDHLLATDGTTPYDRYWVFRAYSSMTGTEKTTTSTSPYLSGFSTATSQSASVLVGRHEGCSPDTNYRDATMYNNPPSVQCYGWYPNALLGWLFPSRNLRPQAPPIDGTVVIEDADRFGAAPVVRVERVVSSQSAPHSNLVLISEGARAVDASGRITVTIPRWVDGDAYLIRVGSALPDRFADLPVPPPPRPCNPLERLLGMC